MSKSEWLSQINNDIGLIEKQWQVIIAQCNMCTQWFAAHAGPKSYSSNPSIQDLWQAIKVLNPCSLANLTFIPISYISSTTLILSAVLYSSHIFDVFKDKEAVVLEEIYATPAWMLILWDTELDNSYSASGLSKGFWSFCCTKQLLAFFFPSRLYSLAFQISLELSLQSCMQSSLPHFTLEKHGPNFMV